MDAQSARISECIARLGGDRDDVLRLRWSAQQAPTDKLDRPVRHAQLGRGRLPADFGHPLGIVAALAST